MNKTIVSISVNISNDTVTILLFGIFNVLNVLILISTHQSVELTG